MNKINLDNALSRAEMKSLMAGYGGSGGSTPCTTTCGTWGGTTHHVSCYYSSHCYRGHDFVNCDHGTVVGCWDIPGYY